MSRKNLNIQNKLTIIDQVSIGKYLQELNTDKNSMPLTPDMEHKLFVEYKKTGNRAIKDRLITANLRWVITIAKQFSYPKARLEDLLNEGNIGLIKAFDKFDPTRGTTFLTFATWYIRQEISIFINDTLSDMVQPANRYRINRIIARAERILRSSGNDSPTSEQLVDMYMEMKESTDPVLTVVDYNEIKMQTRGFVSMEQQLADTDGDDMTLGSTFKAGHTYAADYDVNKNERQLEIVKLLSVCLTEREKTIVEYSFGLNGREEKTLDQVSDIMYITRERVGQLLHGSLRKLKDYKDVVFESCGSQKDTVHSIEANHWSYASKSY